MSRGRAYVRKGLVYIRNCAVCGLLFETGHNKQVVCSKACRARHKAPSQLGRNVAGFAGPRTRACIVCGLPFERVYRKWRQTMCSDACRDIHKANGKNVARENSTRLVECVVCGIQFEKTNHRQITCSEKCRDVRRRQTGAQYDAHRNRSRTDAERTDQIPRPNRVWYTLQGEGRRGTPPHYYVYGWYDERLRDWPFYVGMGKDGRAWQDHRDQECERYRCGLTRVVIYRSNLTAEGALLLEGVLYNLFLAMGAPLTNQAVPSQRRESPPLTYIE